MRYLRSPGRCIEIERHYSELAGRTRADGRRVGERRRRRLIYFVQARPETAASRRKTNVVEEYHLATTEARPDRPAERWGPRSAAGPVASSLAQRRSRRFSPGDVLVAESTTPDWEPIMKPPRDRHQSRRTNLPRGDRGARTRHSRRRRNGERDGEYGPASAMTVSCAQGEQGRVYAGGLRSSATRSTSANCPRRR